MVKTQYLYVLYQQNGHEADEYAASIYHTAEAAAEAAGVDLRRWSISVDPQRINRNLFEHLIDPDYAEDRGLTFTKRCVIRKIALGERL